MDAVDFERFTALTRDDLGQLQATKTAGGFAIERVALSNDIQSEKEVVSGLSAALLDRIGRFLRLARSTGYTLAELDELLQTQRIADAQPFSDAGLKGLARFKRLATSLGLSVESLLGVLDHIPDPADETRRDVARRPTRRHRAHRHGWISGRRSITRISTPVNPADATVDPQLPALLNVVGLVESDLLAVFAQCPTGFPFDAHGNCQLTADNVSLLYAYATLARVWRIAPTDLALVVDRLLPGAPGHDIRTLDLLEALQEAIALVKSLPLPIADAFSLIDPATALISIDAVISAVSDLQSSGARFFGTSVLTSLKKPARRSRRDPDHACRRRPRRGSR